MVHRTHSLEGDNFRAETSYVFHAGCQLFIQLRSSPKRFEATGLLCFASCYSKLISFQESCNVQGTICILQAGCIALSELCIA